MRSFSLAALLIIQSVFAFAQYTPATVPNTKLVNNSYVSNPDGVISESAVAQIDSTSIELERQTTAQVSVVVLKSIGDADIFDFAQELFNLWGIGNTNNNGLLILLVEDQHTVRFHTGLQLEGVLPDVVCKQIQRDQMVPSFKEGDYDSGMINGVAEVSRILTDPDYAQEIAATGTEDTSNGYSSFLLFVGIFLAPIFFIAWAVKNTRFSDSKHPEPTDFPQMRMKRSTWLILFGGIPMLIIIYYWIVPSAMPHGDAFWTLYLYLEATILYRFYRERRMIKRFVKERKIFEITDYLRKSQWYWLGMAFLFPLPFFLYYPIHLVRKALSRNRSRQCQLCEGNMKKLNEKEDDQYLTKAQIKEEELRSVDYDVWQCKECGGTEAWHFINRLSRYKECPSCKALAFYLASDRTIKAATYSSSGKGETTHLCKVCSKKKVEAYTISQLQRSSSSSSSGGSSWSSSSSSSSGGSWGGGRSGGGGASSSW